MEETNNMNKKNNDKQSNTSSTNRDPFSPPALTQHVDYRSKAETRRVELEALRQQKLTQPQAARLHSAAAPTEFTNFEQKQRHLLTEHRNHQKVAMEMLHQYRSDDQWELHQGNATPRCRRQSDHRHDSLSPADAYASVYASPSHPSTIHSPSSSSSSVSPDRQSATEHSMARPALVKARDVNIGSNMLSSMAAGEILDESKDYDETRCSLEELWTTNNNASTISTTAAAVASTTATTTTTTNPGIEHSSTDMGHLSSSPIAFSPTTFQEEMDVHADEDQLQKDPWMTEQTPKMKNPPARHLYFDQAFSLPLPLPATSSASSIHTAPGRNKQDNQSTTSTTTTPESLEEHEHDDDDESQRPVIHQTEIPLCIEEEDTCEMMMGDQEDNNTSTVDRRQAPQSDPLPATDRAASTLSVSSSLTATTNRPPLSSKTQVLPAALLGDPLPHLPREKMSLLGAVMSIYTSRSPTAAMADIHNVEHAVAAADAVSAPSAPSSCTCTLDTEGSGDVVSTPVPTVEVRRQAKKPTSKRTTNQRTGGTGWFATSTKGMLARQRFGR